MCQKRLLIFISSLVLTLADNIPCDKQTLQVPEGTIDFNTHSQENVSCVWTILPPEDTITSLKVVTFNFENCHTFYSCLSISSSQQVHLKLCKQKQDKLIWLSLRESEIAVVLETCGSSTNLRLEFSTRRRTECPKSDFQCLDKSNCYNSSDICGDEFICNDHSDHLGCGGCNDASTLCNNYSNHCFRISQRCDDNLDCPRGEDEMNCTTLCPQFKCRLEPKCITSEQICDRHNDCNDGFDEENCVVDTTKTSKILIISTMLVICCMCCTVFLCLIFRWIITRRDVNRFMENLPEFPLAPFQGPGEEDSEVSSNETLEADFRSGGEFYEHYMDALKKKSQCSKAIQVGGITPKYSHLELDGENEFVVLASLNVPTEMCVGLSISSSKNTIKTLKSIGNTNETSTSSCCDVGPSEVLEPELYFDSETEMTTFTRKRNKSIPSGHRVTFFSSIDDSKEQPSSSGSLLRKKTSKGSKPCVKFSEHRGNSKSGSYFGGGDCLMQQQGYQLESMDAEMRGGATSGSRMMMDEVPAENQKVLVSNSKTNKKPIESSGSIMKRNPSAPLPGTTKHEALDRVSKSINNLGENIHINDDESETKANTRFELVLKSDSSQWTDFDDAIKKSNIILVKPIEKNPKPLKRSCRKKISFSCK